MQTKSHIWQFSKIGGVSRVNLESGSDLLHLNQLDQKLWTALSCPVTGLEIDSKTLELIDIDNDGRIRVPEIVESVKWILSLVKDADRLVNRSRTMKLSDINIDTELGQTLYASARQLLANIGKPEADEISVEDASDTVAIFADTIFNGDGIIIPESTDDEVLKTLIMQVLQCESPIIDRSGKEGIDTTRIEAFYAHCEAYSNWKLQAEEGKGAIFPFGDATEEAYALFLQLKSKIDDFFLRCQLAEFDQTSVETLNSINARIEAITEKELPDCMDEIANFPIAKIEAKKSLRFDTGVNPAWKERLVKFKELTFANSKKANAELDEKEWKLSVAKFDAYIAWIDAKAGVEVEPLGLDTIRQCLAENRKEDLLSLIATDLKLEVEANNIILVEQMVRYYRDLFTLLNNFVTFSDFYKPDSKAIFQAGTLYFDQRACDLCIKVSDMGKHNSMAASSGICLVYFDCISKMKNEKMTIVAAFTDGDVDNLTIGRNAIFYDNKGLDWDATIIKIIDNPISIRQAFWSPYRKFGKFISKQVEKFAASKDDQVMSSTTAKMEKVSTQVATSPAEAAKPTPFDIAKFAGIFAAIGLAIGAIGGFLAIAAKGFFSLVWWKMPLAILGIILLISGPSMILAWLKLRKRNLAPILDANGWAINARATINIVFGATLTHLAKLPKNSKLNLVDPYRKRSYAGLIFWLVVVALVVLYFLSIRYGWLVKLGIIDNTVPIGTDSMK